MIADVQYNDLRGTAAADVSDHCDNSLQKYLSSTYESYDSERYSCVGSSIWISGQSVEPCANVTFICWDKQLCKHIRIRLARSLHLEDVFQIFKRFEVVLGIDINEVEVDEDDTIIIDQDGEAE